MKKFFTLSILTIAVVACNNEATSDSTVKDSALEKIDSLGQARMDSVKQATDSLQKTVEATFEKTDSANKALADSAARNNQ